jgi:hypothetical protein
LRVNFLIFQGQKTLKENLKGNLNSFGNDIKPLKELFPYPRVGKSRLSLFTGFPFDFLRIKNALI